MVEIGIFPAALVVATLALLTQFATMAFILIILLVTGNTFGWQLDLIDQPLFRQMTSIALGLPVLTSKRIVGVVIMIEVDLLPPYRCGRTHTWYRNAPCDPFPGRFSYGNHYRSAVFSGMSCLRDNPCT